MYLYYMVLLRGVSAALGLLLGAQVRLIARPSAMKPQALLTGSCDQFSLTVSDGRRVLPMESFSVESRSPVQLGWKAPALLITPIWVLLAPHLLPVLMVVWLGFPGGPQSGALDFDALIRERDLNERRGAWPALLSAVLTAIARASLPALLLDHAEAPGGAPRLGARVPSSECVGASVVGSKLVFEGRVPVKGGEALEYTLRTGVSARRSTELGVPEGTPAAGEHSTVCWDEPELRLSLGETGLAGMLPKMWVPVAPQQAVPLPLPRCVYLTRAAVSEAAGGLRASGVIRLGASDTEAAGGLVTI